jgi:TPP-dependent pyruvate/acetoin dehydrogenase alpha subunit
MPDPAVAPGPLGAAGAGAAGAGSGVAGDAALGGMAPAGAATSGAEAPAPLPERWRETLRLMVLSRVIENKLNNLFLQGRVRGRLISGRGQEAIPVGAATCTEPRDLVCPAHRDLGAHLARGTTPYEVFLQYLWREGGPSRGRDGDVHFGVWQRGVLPMISHLPDSWPIAVGLALAKQREGSGGVVLAFCGDGATSAGAWHESVNLASVWQVPMVLVVENNQYAYSTPNAMQFRVATLAERASGYGIPGWRVDGNDVSAVHDAVARAVAAARGGGGPTLIEAVTMRMDGHAIHDPAQYVPRELLEHWRRRDPIDLFAARLREDGLLDSGALDAIRRQAEREVDEAYELALVSPEPDPASLETGVYAAPPPPSSTHPAHG